MNIEDVFVILTFSLSIY